MKAMLSIKPEYVDRILSGEKTYEFRRKIFRRTDIEAIVIYATKPRCAVVAEAEIAGIIEDNPEDLWAHTYKHGGISKDKFMAYFHGRTVAYAIKLEHVKQYVEPRPLSEYAPEVKTPPQSYVYLTR